jgi:uncharacterized protein (TIGR00369 family)
MPESVAPRRFGVVPLEQARTMSGLRLLEGLRDGRFPSPPMCRILRGDVVEVEYGRIVFEGEPSEDFFNTMGYVHGGFAATMLDSCLGSAVHTTVPAGQGYTTIEVKVNFVRPLTDRTGRVRAEGKVVAAGNRIATAEGRLTDGAGELLAHGTTTCLIFTV